MRLFKVALLAGVGKGVASLSCHTCHGGPDIECPLQECPRDGQEYACQNEIRTHNGRYEVKKVKYCTLNIYATIFMRLLLDVQTKNGLR